MSRKRRRRIEPADNHTPDLTPRCEAQDCSEFPFYGVKMPSIERRVWLCTTHYRYWLVDSMRAQTLAWQRDQEAMIAAALGVWVEEQSALVEAELRLNMGPASRPFGWGCAKPIRYPQAPIGKGVDLVVP